MKYFVAFIAVIAASVQAWSEPRLPIDSGRYVFQHRFAEHPGMPSISLTAEIKGTHIVLTNRSSSDVFPEGIVADGTMMWHAGSKQWIIGDDPSDRYAEDVGGCSDGPEVIDLGERTYWTC